jgi:hypothetical protein
MMMIVSANSDSFNIPSFSGRILDGCPDNLCLS